MAIAFDYNFYLEQKLAQLQGLEGYEDFTNTAQVVAAFEEAGLTVKEHYEQFGAAEGLNPSADFDTDAYLNAKLEQLQGLGGYEDIQTTDDVLAAFKEAGLSPLDHYNQFGIDEGLEATPVDNTANLTEDLAAYETAVEAESEAEVAFSDATVEAELVAEGDADEDGVADAFDPANNDYVALAEADVQTATASLASDRATVGSDAEVDNAVVEAQQAVNAYSDQRFDELGAASTTGTTYSLAQLQARATNAQAAYEANVAAEGETADLAQDLDDAIALYLSEGNADTATTDLATLVTAINAYLADTSAANAEATLLDAVDAAHTALNVDEDGNSDLDDVARADAVENLLVTLDERDELSDAAVANQTAFEAAEDIAVTDGAFDDVTFANGETDLTAALATQSSRDDLVEALETAQADKASVEAASGTYADAQQAVSDAAEELGYDIQDVDSSSLLGTDESDLFIFNAEAAEDAGLSAVSINGFESDDLLFLGTDYAVGTEGSEDNNALEAFITEANGNAVLQIENTAFGSASDDFTEITLTGVAAADVSIENGVVSIA